MTESVDLIVVGGGGGGLSAALAAASAGLKTLVIEKESVVGGSTAVSGGALWIPANPLMQRDGIADSRNDALAYLQAVVGDVGPASSSERRAAFLDAAPDYVRFLEGEGFTFVRHAGRADYYDDRAGGHQDGRSIEVALFDVNTLGADLKLLRLGSRRLPVSGAVARHLFLAGRTLKGRFHAAVMGARMLAQRVTGGMRIGVGGALAGRLLLACRARGVAIWTDSPVTDLIRDGNRIAGVIVQRGDTSIEVRARYGVVLASSGFGRNAELRGTHQPQLRAVHTHASPGETGEVLEAAIRAGAATDMLDHAIWIPCALPPGAPPLPLVQELAKPFCFVVDQSGVRFFNEAGSHVESAMHMIERTRQSPDARSWFIMDSRHRRYYPWGMTLPGFTPAAWVESGYFKKADTPEDLARQCGIDPDTLRDTIDSFNAQARLGKDPQFGRGARAYDRYFGDPKVGPNPCLGPVSNAPFYAVAIYPGDLGTSGGLLTDATARVLDREAKPIPGLYAAGNITASIFGRAYPGAGASIAAACVFGFLAARAAADRCED